MSHANVLSTVEVGEIFREQEGKTKKQAELNVAKVPYFFLKHGKSLFLL
jgi:hypothetical protein